MSQLDTKFYCDDAAERIAEMIQEEEQKLHFATRSRDKHRGETTIRALKQALEIVLLERKCEDRNPHPMPDIAWYLTQHGFRKNPPAA